MPSNKIIQTVDDLVLKVAKALGKTEDEVVSEFGKDTARLNKALSENSVQAAGASKPIAETISENLNKSNFDKLKYPAGAALAGGAALYGASKLGKDEEVTSDIPVVNAPVDGEVTTSVKTKVAPKQPKEEIIADTAVAPTRIDMKPVALPTLKNAQQMLDEANKVAANEANSLPDEIKRLADTKIQDLPNAPDLKDAAEQYKATINEAMNAWKQEKDDLKRKQLWDGIIKGVAQIAAGVYALRTGNYIGNIQFDPVDWASMARDNMDMLNAQMGRAATQYNQMTDAEKAKYQADVNRISETNKNIWNAALMSQNAAKEARNTMLSLTQQENVNKMSLAQLDAARKEREANLQLDVEKLNEMKKANADRAAIDKQQLAIQQQGANLELLKTNMSLKQSGKPLISQEQYEKAGKALRESITKGRDERKAAVVDAANILGIPVENLSNKVDKWFGPDTAEPMEPNEALNKINTIQSELVRAVREPEGSAAPVASKYSDEQITAYMRRNGIPESRRNEIIQYLNK